MKEMNMDYLKPKKGERENEKQEKSVDNEEEKSENLQSTKDVLRKHAKQAQKAREEINKLAPNSEERKRKKQSLRRIKLIESKSFWQSKRKNKEE